MFVQPLFIDPSQGRFRIIRRAFLLVLSLRNCNCLYSWMQLAWGLSLFGCTFADRS